VVSKTVLVVLLLSIILGKVFPDKCVFNYGKVIALNVEPSHNNHDILFIGTNDYMILPTGIYVTNPTLFNWS
jgi:hypothetical protein